jgi:hypothetical protein
LIKNVEGVESYDMQSIVVLFGTPKRRLEYIFDAQAMPHLHHALTMRRNFAAEEQDWLKQSSPAPSRSPRCSQ